VPADPSATAMQSPSRKVWRGAGVPAWVDAVLIAVVAAGLRMVAIGSAEQVSVDEIFYTSLGHSVRLGHIPPLIGASGTGATSGQPFLLHPPGYFVLAAVWEVVAGRPADLVDQMVRARALNLVLATVSAVLIYWIGRRIATRWAAVLGALVFAIDPFVLRQNGVTFLETASVMWLLAGLLLLLRAIQDGDRRPPWLVVTAGFCLGLAIVTKDMAAIPAIGMLAAVWFYRWGVPRRSSVRAIGAALAPYAAYVVATLAQGYAHNLYDAKTLGIRRALGIEVTTGFNTAHSPSLTGRLVGQATTFSVSYLLVAVGATAGLWLLVRATDPARRLVGVFTVMSAVLVAYSVAFGTSEEQFLYFLIVPGILALVACAPGWRAQLDGRSRRARRVVFSLLALALVLDLVAWGQVRLGQQDTLAQFVSYLHHEIPAGSTVAYTNGMTQFALQSEGYRAVPLGSPQSMDADHVRFVAALPSEIQGGYSWVTPSSWVAYERASVQTFTTGSSSPIVVRRVDPGGW
jgi:4-amino-4-deoxy-L-arabinose transferase-like glycosyltransferase